MLLEKFCMFCWKSANAANLNCNQRPAGCPILIQPALFGIWCSQRNKDRMKLPTASASKSDPTPATPSKLKTGADGSNIRVLDLLWEKRNRVDSQNVRAHYVHRMVPYTHFISRRRWRSRRSQFSRSPLNFSVTTELLQRSLTHTCDTNPLCKLLNMQVLGHH